MGKGVSHGAQRNTDLFTESGRAGKHPRGPGLHGEVRAWNMSKTQRNEQQTESPYKSIRKTTTKKSRGIRRGRRGRSKSPWTRKGMPKDGSLESLTKTTSGKKEAGNLEERKTSKGGLLSA